MSTSCDKTADRLAGDEKTTSNNRWWYLNSTFFGLIAVDRESQPNYQVNFSILILLIELSNYHFNTKLTQTQICFSINFSFFCAGEFPLYLYEPNFL